jgi:AcrR family transcriptional regulator
MCIISDYFIQSWVEFTPFCLPPSQKRRRPDCIFSELNTHENILSVAARSFREHGSDSSGIGTVMKKIGLTKGGFYRHFESKDDLFVKAVARAFDEMEAACWKLQSPRPKARLCGPSSNTI